MDSDTSKGDSMLQPGQIIRPELSITTATKLVEHLYGIKVKTIKEQVSYDDRNFCITVEEQWENSNIKSLCPHGYVFKILNSMDTPKQHVEAEHQMQAILHTNGFRCPMPVLNVHGKDKSIEKMFVENAETDDNENCSYKLHMCRLLEFVPGRIFHSVPYEPLLIYQAGRYLAKMHLALKDFQHPALTNHKTIWSLLAIPDLRQFIHVVRGEERKSLIHSVIQAFEQEVVPNYEHFTKGVIHGDYNEQNILVEPTQQPSDSNSEPQPKHSVSGILDFGDAQDTFYAFEVATGIMYLSVESTIVDPLLVGGHLLAGYTSLRPLNPQEWDALKVCTAGRYCQSLGMGEYTFANDPSNEYVLVTAKRGWSQLEKICQTSKEELYNKWREVMQTYS